MSSIPSGGNFIFADFETNRCQFCTKMSEMSALCYLGKTRLGLGPSPHPMFPLVGEARKELVPQILRPPRAGRGMGYPGR